MSLLASSAKKFKRADLFFFRLSRRRALSSTLAIQAA